MMNRIDNSGSGIARLGRNEDNYLAHVAQGEMVVPPVITPETRQRLEQEMMMVGLDPNEYKVGNGMSINPITGNPEFGFLKKIGKSLKKVVKKVAPIAGIAAAFIPGVGPAISGALGGVGTAVTGALGNIPGIGGLISGKAPFLKGKTGILGLLQRDPNDQGNTNPLIKLLGDQLGFGGRSAELDRLTNPNTGQLYTSAEIAAMSDEQKAQAIMAGREEEGGKTTAASLANMFGGDSKGGGLGNLGIAGLAGLVGKLAYDEAKDFKGVPLTPLTTMDQLGRYNIAAEIARQKGEEMPSRVEYGLNPQGLPVLQGGMPRQAAYGGAVYNQADGDHNGIMAFADGGVVEMQNGGEPPIDPANFPVKEGQIDGPGTETSDDIPAMLSDGEFVMTAKAVKGAGAFDVNDSNGILTLTPNGDPSRDSGTRVMYKLMDHFGGVA